MFIDRVKLKLIFLPSYTFRSADINVLKILPVPAGEAGYFIMLIYSFFFIRTSCGGAPGQISFKYG